MISIDKWKYKCDRRYSQDRKDGGRMIRLVDEGIRPLGGVVRNRGVGDKGFYKFENNEFRHVDDDPGPNYLLLTIDDLESIYLSGIIPSHINTDPEYDIY